jgi:UDP-N-acetylmuramoylalanine--D-glutamate ligase
MSDAVCIASSVANSGDAVLMSPACASFDMFRNYLHRAEVFIAAVHALEAEATCASRA